MSEQTWATIVVEKWQGGRSFIVNESGRGLFERGATYYNHQLKQYPKGTRLNVVVRLSKTGRRMVQKISHPTGVQDIRVKKEMRFEQW